MDYFLADSECSSGCESGWTLYLDNSFISPYENGNGNVVDGKFGGFSGEKRTDEEEDMSMVSDASSGPPHFPEESSENYAANLDNHNHYFYHAPADATLCKNRAKKQKSKENPYHPRNKVHEKSSLLDDTASSPVFSLPSTNFKLGKNHHASAETRLDFSHGYSTTHFEGSSGYHQQYGFSEYSSPSGNYYEQQNQWYGGRMWQQ